MLLLIQSNVWVLKNKIFILSDYMSFYGNFDDQNRFVDEIYTWKLHYLKYLEIFIF